MALSFRPARIRLIVLGGLFAVVMGIAGFFLLRPFALHRPVVANQAGEDELAKYPRPAIGADDGGYNEAMNFLPQLKNPQSLEEIRQRFANLGQRGIFAANQELSQPDLTPERRMDLLLSRARLQLYEGAFLPAAESLAQARALSDADEPRFRKDRLTLIFLQGIAALRRGETENCVMCQCQGSCIFPIEAPAVHQNRVGSEQAIQYFLEYLSHVPDDIGVRWLLNICYMTLGSYPDGVPPKYLIPMDKFQSQMDIGRFIDVAPQLGLNRFNQAGGAIMDDFFNHGLFDLVMTSLDPAMPMHLYKNRGNGTFEECSASAGLAGQLGGLNCVQTDYRNSGFLDIYVCRGAWSRSPQRHSLLRNNGDGTFTDVTHEAGLAAPVDGQVAVWADFDNDGYLDLFVGSETGRSHLYHNKGDGTFEDVTDSAGVANLGQKCKGASWCDFDGDGYPDLYVSNLGGQNRLFRNNRNGTFTDVAPLLGVTKPGGFACWFFDYDNDGWPDIFATAYEWSLNDNVKSQLGLPNGGNTCRLYRNLKGHGFQDVSAQVGLNQVIAPMGSNFADFTNDGFLDIYLGTGTPNYSMLLPNRMFKNDSGRRFVDITTSSGTGHLQKGHAVACGDLFHSGLVEMLVELGGATPGDQFRNALFKNPGNDKHWLSVKLVGQKTNRAAIGARIKVVPAGEERSIFRWVNSGGSFGGNTLQQHIGVGKAEHVATLEVYWPTSQTTQVFHDIAVDQAIEITEFAKEYRPLNWKKLPRP
jgi:hypothetical protein